MVRKIMIIIASITLIISSYKIGSYFYDGMNNKKLYDDIISEYKNISKDNKDKSKSFEKINENIVGWIEIPSTNINYPIVQTEDNSYYLNHDINNKESIHGSIFMDYTNKDWDDKNVVIYGHHMKDGTMFKDLVKFKNEDFINKNKEIYIDIGDRKNEYEIFSVLLTKGDSNYIDTNFKSKEEFLSYIDYIKKNSTFYKEVDFNNKNIITLSTCSYEFDDARTVIYAIKK
ncbi:MAG: class B sortase [Senegalia sp. (in: firmicutes)]|uniref:class B sortase n=1 Tax=Senegalia sp. (in: firmicutes) TaxID=1924098 RepID=UPI003F9AE9C2